MKTTIELLNELKEVIIPLCSKMQTEKIDIMNIRDEHRHLHNKNLDLIKTNEALERQNEELKLQGQKIIEEAKKEADAIIKVIEENFIVARKERALAEEDRKKAGHELNMAINKAKEIAA